MRVMSSTNQGGADLTSVDDILGQIIKARVAGKKFPRPRKHTKTTSMPTALPGGGHPRAGRPTISLATFAEVQTGVKSN